MDTRRHPRHITAMRDPVPAPHRPSTPFVKMHGLGNDFAVIDRRGAGNGAAANGTGAILPEIGAGAARAIADRRTGVGCDQLILIEPPQNPLADVFMRIRNADGGEVEACGNGARCVAALLMAETGRPHVVIETVVGLLDAEAGPDGRVSVDMGQVRLDWRDIPIAKPMDTLHLDLALGPLADPVAVNIGNPHIVFFVPDAEAVDIARLGPELERHPLFPERTNVEAATVLGPERIRMRVWERGVGVTRACGTGACATLVAAARRKLLAGRRATLVLDGGELEIEWLADDHVRMTGPATVSFTGRLDASLLG
jgi:diaminopimelate epimerase